eukprot:COSAG06_NODE_2956_length_6028_cov_7.551864_7_plen_115_part_00
MPMHNSTLQPRAAHTAHHQPHRAGSREEEKPPLYESMPSTCQESWPRGLRLRSISAELRSPGSVRNWGEGGPKKGFVQKTKEKKQTKPATEEAEEHDSTGQGKKRAARRSEGDH